MLPAPGAMRRGRPGPPETPSLARAGRRVPGQTRPSLSHGRREDDGRVAGVDAVRRKGDSPNQTERAESFRTGVASSRETRQRRKEGASRRLVRGSRRGSREATFRGPSSVPGDGSRRGSDGTDGQGTARGVSGHRSDLDLKDDDSSTEDSRAAAAGNANATINSSRNRIITQCGERACKNCAAEPEAGGADRRRERRAETAKFSPCAVTLAGRAGHRENQGAKLGHGRGGGAEARVNASCNVSFARVGGGDLPSGLGEAKISTLHLHVTLVVLLLLLAELIDLLPPNFSTRERLSSLPPSLPPEPMARPLAGRPGYSTPLNECRVRNYKASGHQWISLRGDPKPPREPASASRRPGCRARAWQRWTGPVSAAAFAWASGLIRWSFRAGIPSARTASGKTDARTLALPKRNSAVDKPRRTHFLLLISGWKTKYSIYGRRTEEQRGRRCPLCRGTIPPSREQISLIKMTEFAMKKMNKSDPDYEAYARKVKQFEAEYGEDWEDTAIEYGNDCVSLPFYVVEPAAKGGNFRTTTLQWLGKGNIKDRVNAKCENAGNIGLLFLAADAKEHDLMIFLLLNGADVNIMTSDGFSALATICNGSGYLTAVKILLSWGAEIFIEGRRASSQDMKQLYFKTIMKGNVAVANLLSSELGGRRCKIVSTPDTRDDLVGKTCVVGGHIEKSSNYEVTVEFTNESLLLGADILERCDRTPQDPGYFVECKNNKLIRRDFESNEKCQAFIASLGKDEGLLEVDPQAEAKAEQAAADLLAELGLDDLEDVNSNAQKKVARSAPPAGKKKKRGGKKKGRK
ncbi:hypothetical protein THAOC_33367 [Thalassiosira oceanica]|uniref:Uncharacterized protein n=1 Tax=Thalassiosira oceanica TaxID=159749 RepID=K0RFY8_THAOC|nr:hypothetical protein THAOC_33367 [Thalassiosira oceanica]|eukprot:EJK47886.1 hypothetical protein THAOC_33367 [Thalassiosira oceanica]